MAQQRSEVVVLIGTGSIGQAIARRISAGKILILADSNLDNAELSARSLLQTGFTAVPTTVDVTSRESVQPFAISPSAKDTSPTSFTPPVPHPPTPPLPTSSP